MSAPRSRVVRRRFAPRAGRAGARVPGGAGMAQDQTARVAIIAASRATTARSTRPSAVPVAATWPPWSRNAAANGAVHRTVAAARTPTVRA
ncbi:hypothetical protein [Dactylosporangium sp. NPDC006015]|uniref:hypothetical protein n=1 Tax=Dactylosporangium sp. NPDC006015 TaxID=3154576 RepID=UPI0033B6DA54